MLRLPRLYAIVDADLAAARGWTPASLARAYLSAGVRLLQVRAKALPGGALLDLCDDIVAAARPAGALVIVNDRADIARLAGAAGVHLGQEDLSPSGARRLLGPDSIVGLSTHTAAQIDRALLAPISYLAVGPVFATATKATGYDAVGFDLVRHAVGVHADRAARSPLVAIGGITLDRAASVIAAGASSVAVISDLLTTGDPAGRARQFLEALGEAPAAGAHGNV